ncbi:hypothetical protein COHA_010715 [Chlorella ohadii]|uniref:Uncharacterized protein n=1 Tax=Chlorella ohadii TaxID=2649997 RepID=A0AAD5DFS7_9CHLO|nr:hypothetical protein COHA_010715 [Chlorella ohadii]
MYRCSRYPKNHCNVCCPLEVTLVPLRPSGTPHASAARQQQQQKQRRQQLQQQQRRLSSTASMGVVGSPVSPVAGSSGEAADEGRTPSQEHCPPRLPAAPTKSSSVDSRQRDERAAAQRSLDFNAISIQAIRARQLGAQYMVMRPSARQVARMQQQAAVTPAAAGPSSAKDAGRKRGRDPPSPLQRQPLQELMVSGGGQQQQAQRRRQQPEQAPAPQPAAGSGAGTWLKNAAHRP